MSLNPLIQVFNLNQMKIVKEVQREMLRLNPLIQVFNLNKKIGFINYELIFRVLIP